MRKTSLTRRRKRRSGWKHPLDLNRNRRRCMKRRRSASVRARRSLQEIRAQELVLELREARIDVVAARPREAAERRPNRGRAARRPASRLEPRRAW